MASQFKPRHQNVHAQVCLPQCSRPNQPCVNAYEMHTGNASLCEALQAIWLCHCRRMHAKHIWHEATDQTSHVLMNFGNKPKNSSWTLMNRGTMTTLSTYNTWIHTSRLQKVYHFSLHKFQLQAFLFQNATRNSAKAYQWSCANSNGQQHCIASTDSDLEAFSRNPTDGSFATLAFQLATFTKYLNEVFLSY